jgi:tRNA(adenine34) deaminase
MPLPLDDHHLMDLALEQARQALAAGEFPVGCVVADDRRVLASAGRRGSRGPAPSELDHAEIIALRRLDALAEPAARGRLTLVTTLEPCLMCYGAILLAGIGRIVYAYEDVMGGGTGCPLDRLPPLYGQRAAEIRAGVRRTEALALFHAFFADPGNGYWRQSLLAGYTLAQAPG